MFSDLFSVTHNITFNKQNGTKDEPIKDFAYICIDQSVDLQSLIDHYFYPISLSVSMMCFILTFLLYSFLPQLRDLTGKFILGICLCLCVTFASLLVKQFGLKDSNVVQMWVEVVLHASIVGVWFCLSSMVCFCFVISIIFTLLYSLTIEQFLMQLYLGCTLVSNLIHSLMLSNMFSAGGGAIYDAPKARGGAIFDAHKP